MEIRNSQFGFSNGSQIGSKPESALVAMSGGVDSTVAAMLAIEGGLDCAGATMKLYPSGNGGEEDARSAARSLGIPFYVFDFSAFFATRVIERFVNAYREGKTPNPCVDCNKYIKFGCLLEKARELGKDYVVSGHYAQIERSAGGRFLLKKGADTAKDQSYVLYGLTQGQLARIRFPLGGATKPQVREMALGAGLENSDKRESQDICFVPDGEYAKFITEYTGDTPRKGRFVDAEGNDLGENRGVIHYTIGQRRGLGLAMMHPVYVLDIRTENDTVVIGENGLLYSKVLHINDINLIPLDKLGAPIKARVKIRYKQPEQPAAIYQIEEDTIRIEFEEPQRAITRGQAAVIYDGDVVIGGGTIA